MLTIFDFANFVQFILIRIDFVAICETQSMYKS